MSRNRNRNRRPEGDPSVVHFGNHNDQRDSHVVIGDVARGTHVAARPQPAAAQTPAVFRFSRPVVIDTSKADMDDMILVMEVQGIAAAGSDNEAFGKFILAHIGDIRSLINRIVEGGMKGRPAAEFFPLLGKVIETISGLGDSGN